jgi:hypothetical protein
VVRHLHAFRACGRAARVVDRRGRVLVGVEPRLRLYVELVELLVSLGAEDELVLRLHGSERFVEFGIHEQHRRTRVLDDVRDLVGREPKLTGTSTRLAPSLE